MTTTSSSSESARAIIGCIALQDTIAMPGCLNAGLQPESLPATERTLYAWACERYAKGRPIGALEIGQAIADMALTVPTRYVESCIDSVGTVMHVAGYVERVQAEYLSARVKELATNHAKIAASAVPDTVHDVIDRIAGEWGSLETPQARNEPLPMVCERLLAEWEKPIDTRGGISWPLPELDRHLGQLTSEYVIFAAHPSVGKTAMAVNLMIHNAVAGRRMSMKYIESTREQVAPRFLSVLAKVNTQRMRLGRASESDFVAARVAAKRLRDLPLSVDDNPATCEQLLAWGQQEKARGSKCLVIDNMKHIITRGRYDNRVELFCHLSAGVKRVRDATGLPVVLLHHLAADDGMSWGRDVARDADIILTMKSDEDRTELPDANNHWIGTWINVIGAEKVRDGMAGFSVSTRFDKERQTFEPMERKREVKDEWTGDEDFTA